MAYTKLFSLPKDQYCPTSPLVIAAGALLKDEKTGSIVAQLKLRSVSPEEIVAVKVKITAFDVSGQQLPQEKEYQYLDLQAMRGEEFGQKQAIVLPDKTARSFAAACVSVVLKNGTKWTMPEDGTWTSLPKQERLDRHLDYGLAEQYKRQTTAKAEFVPLEHEDLWLCTCGGINHSSEKNCCHCRSAYADLVAALNKEMLSEKKKAHDSAAAKEKAEQQEKEAARKKQTAKIAAIVGSIVAAVIIFLIVLNAVIIPNGKYNDAVALMDAGNYEEAIVTFAALDGYKDSTEQIATCETAILDRKYDDTVALMDTGKYEEAIAAFTALGSHRDSKEQITNCETAILDGKYNDAVALMDVGQYEEAIAAFETLNSYQDSDSKVVECTYQIAVVLKNAGNYMEAISVFTGLENYKDSLAQIDDCYIGIYGAELYLKAKDATVGSTITFGVYEQDNNETNGKEEIEWLVLSKDGLSLQLLSKYCIDSLPYNSDCICKYTYSTWSDGTFVLDSFSEAEREVIFMASLLSVDEYLTYSSIIDLATTPTTYAIAMTSEESTSVRDQHDATSWWLIDGGANEYWSGVVTKDHTIDSGNKKIDHGYRPLLWISLDSFSDHSIFHHD